MSRPRAAGETDAGTQASDRPRWLRSLALDDWGVWERCRIELAPGGNLVVGPNGSGKSTLLAGLRFGLFHSHRTRAQELDRWRPLGTRCSPQVRVELELPAGRVRLHKRFGSDPSATLERARTMGGRLATEADPGWQQIAAGRDVEPQLRELLELPTPSGGIARPIEQGPAELLWALQGDPLLPERFNPTAEQLLRTCAAQLLEGTVGRRLAELIDNLHGATFRQNGRPRVQSELYRLEQELERLFARRRELGEQIERHDELQGQLAEQTVQLERAIARLDAAEAALAKLAARHEQALAAERALREAKLAAELARSEHARWRERASELARKAARAAELKATAADASAQLRQLEPELKQLDAEVAQRQIEATLMALRGLQSEAEQIEGLLAQREAKAAQPGPRPTPQQRERFAAQISGLAALPALELELSAESELVVELGDGQQLRLDPGQTRTLDLAALQALAVPGSLRLRLLGELPARRAEIERERAALLSELGLPDADAFVAACQAEDTRHSELQLLEAQLQAAGGPARLAALRARLEELPPEQRAALAEPAGEVAVPERPLAPLLDAQRQLQERVEGERRRRDGAIAASAEVAEPTASGAEPAAPADEAADREAKLLTQVGATEAEQRRLESELAGLADDRRAHANLSAEVERERRELGRRQAETDRLRGALAELKAGEVTEELSELGAELARVERAFEREQLRGEGLRLLHETIARERNRSLEGLLEPIAERVEADLNALGLPLAELRLEGTPLPRGLRLGGGETELGTLSRGWQELTAALIRIAIGEQLATIGPMLVVLDDPAMALDPPRARWFGRRLSEAAQHLQLLVVGCREASYATFDATRHSTALLGRYHAGAPGDPPPDAPRQPPRKTSRQAPRGDGKEQARLF